MKIGPFFSSVDRKNYHCLNFWDIPAGASNFPEVDAEIAAFLKQGKHLVINYQDEEKLPDSLVRAFQLASLDRTAKGYKTMVLAPPKKVTPKIEKPTTGQGLMIAPTLAFAVQEFQKKTDDLDEVQFVSVFASTVMRTLYIHGGLRFRRGKVRYQEGDPNQLRGDVHAFVNVESKNHPYLIFMTFRMRTFLRIMSSIFEEELFSLTVDIADAAKELLNVIYGQSKDLLNVRKAGIRPSTPVFFQGDRFPADNYEINRVTTTLTSGKVVVVPFECGLGEFDLNIWLPDDFDTGPIRGRRR